MTRDDFNRNCRLAAALMDAVEASKRKAKGLPPAKVRKLNQSLFVDGEVG